MSLLSVTYGKVNQVIQLTNIDNIYLTADNHFYHENIIKFTNRPFSDVDEMNQTMIDNWNNITNDDSIIYHLGDFTLHDHTYANSIIPQLNGMIIFITPNFHHDKRWFGRDYVTKSKHVVIYEYPLQLMKIDLGQERPLKITLSHYPLEEWESSYHGALHFHGHSHGNLPVKENRVDVGVDCWDFTPVNLRTLLQYTGKI